MLNAVGRDIPEEILRKTGKDVFRGSQAKDGFVYQKTGPNTRAAVKPGQDKLVPSIRAVLEACGIRDGMTISFHHHFRNGDKVLNMVMEEIHAMGIKDLTISASSMGAQNDPIVYMLDDGTITNIESSGVRGEIGRAISAGRLKGLATMRSHGGRIRAIESGETHIDIAFIGAPTADCSGNLNANGGKADCGVLSYAVVDAQYADKVVAITDTLVDFPNMPAQISQIYVDYVVVVDEIGDPKKIATGAAKPTTDQRKLLMARYCTDFVVRTPYFREGFSYQTGVGGASIASTVYLAEVMRERGIHMGWGCGGIAKPMCELLEEGLIGQLVDTQDFDEYAIRSVAANPKHHFITGSEYANPFNKGAYVNQLDFVILASLEVDTHFNCNVVVGSDCNPTSGSWTSAYDGVTITDSSKVDIDHMVPLAEAWRSGAADWTKDDRTKFANDLTRPQLLAVSASSNRSKGDQTPATWMPTQTSFRCDYTKAWIAVKSYWKLSVDTAEKDALQKELNACA